MDDLKDAGTCGVCGAPLVTVRPGKEQCNGCDFYRDRIERLEAALREAPCYCVPALIREPDGVVVGAAVTCLRCRALDGEDTNE